MTDQVIYVVVRYYMWDKDEYIAAYLEREPAVRHASRLLGHEYDPDDPDEFRVWTIPLGTHLVPA